MGLIADDYQEEMRHYLPPGKALDYEEGSVSDNFWMALSKEPARMGAAADAFLDETDPRTCVAMLPDFERNYGLPDDCSPSQQSVPQRRAALIARVTENFTLTEENIVALAATLGFDVTVTTYKQPRCGKAICAAPCISLQQESTWTVNAPADPITYAICGIARCGDRTSSFGFTQLECVMNEVNSAFLFVSFNFGS